MIGILLAAGFSRRFGEADKLLQSLPDGRPLALAAAQNLRQVLPKVISVVRPENAALRQLLQAAGLEVICCAAQDLEMADSLATGVRVAALHEAATGGYLIALADMPFIQPQTIAAIAAQMQAGAPIVRPLYRERRGHPVAFAPQYRAELEQLRGDQGARAILERHAHAVRLLDCDDPGVLLDIDTPADLGVGS